MTSPIKEELQRVSGRFLFYGRTILIGMSITAIFFTLYAGLRANYLTIQVITVFISTLSVALAGLFFYFAVRIQRQSSRTKSLSETKLAHPELSEEIYFSFGIPSYLHFLFRSTVVEVRLSRNQILGPR